MTEKKTRPGGGAEAPPDADLANALLDRDEGDVEQAHRAEQENQAADAAPRVPELLEESLRLAESIRASGTGDLAFDWRSLRTAWLTPAPPWAAPTSGS